MNETGSNDAADTPTNILKCRDDTEPIFFSMKTEADTEDPQRFILEGGSSCSWVKKDELFGPGKLRPRIEPWLTALCQSEHLSLLLGSGLTHAVHRLGTGEALPGMEAADWGDEGAVVNAEAKTSAELARRGEGNVEDQIRVANELLRGLSILGRGEDESGEKSKAAMEFCKKADSLCKKLSKVLADFASSILKGEQGLITGSDGDRRESAFNYLVSFLMSFASRTGTRDRLHIFTTNYDRFIEAGAEVAGLHLLDRFVGSLAPIFRSSRLDLDMHYNPPGIRGEPRYLEGVTRFTKLHGSVDWVDCARSIRRVGVPFGTGNIAPYLDAAGTGHFDAMRLMIYPNAAKDRETVGHPYVELFRDLAAAICRPNHALMAFGYSFGDEHINRVIEDMLTIPSTHLVVMSYDDSLGRIMSTYEKLGRPAQVTLLIGSHIGAFEKLVDHYLPKPAIDRTTFRMAELLKARWGADRGETQTANDTITSGEGGGS